MDKKILYIDMDGVIADFDKKIATLLPGVPMGDGKDYENRSKMVDKAVSEYPTFFEELEPIKNSIESIKKLRDIYEIYFLSTPMCNVPESYSGKRKWIKKHFGEWADKRLILTHRKDLVIGNILIDDRLKNGADNFKGRLIFFPYNENAGKTWITIRKFLIELE